MKKLITLIILIQFYLITYSQNIIKSPVIIYSISENSIIKRSGKEIRLDSLLVCNFDDELEVVKGKVYAYNGNEIYLNPGDKINIVRKKNDEPNDIDKVSRFINEPSVHLPNLYNNTRASSLNIFPVYSAVYNVKNIDIIIPKKIHHRLNWRLYNSLNDSLIIEIKEVASDFVPDTLNLIKGQSYHWKLFNENTSFKGKIKLITSLNDEAIIPKQFNNKSDYLSAFNIFVENDCIFDAMSILHEGQKQYPDCEIFTTLLSKFLIPVE